MKNKRVKNRAWMILVCGLCVLFGCGKQQDDTIEITMIHGWGSTGADHVAMRQIYEDFEKEHPWIHLNLIAMPSSTDVVDKVEDLLTVGDIPDIVFTGGEGKESVYSFMTEKGYAVDLMPYIKEDEELAGNISSYILQSWQNEDGKMYTISDVLLRSGYWYNRQIFDDAGIEKVPATWDEWLEMCEKVAKLSSESNTPLVPIVLDMEHIGYLTAALLVDEGAEEAAKIGNDKINVNTEAFERALEKLEKMSVHARLDEEYNYLDTLSSFNKGESAVYINGVWASSMIEEDLPVSYAPFPSQDGAGIAARSACVGYILGNTGDEKRIAASVEFLKYMMSEAVAERILVLTGQNPSNPNVEITSQNSSERMKQAVMSVENAGVLMEIPENRWNLRGQEEYEKNVICYLKGDISKSEFLERMSEVAIKKQAE